MSINVHTRPTYEGPTPPDEWWIDNFTDNGEVTYCPRCGSVPVVPLYGGCSCGLGRVSAMINSVLTPWVTERCDPDRLIGMQSEYTNDQWSCWYHSR